MDHHTARQNLLDSQLRPNLVTDQAVLARFANLPREKFTSHEHAHLAYADAPVPQGHGRMLLSPLALACLVQALQLKATDRVLVLAAGTGYAVAVMAPLVTSVVAVEDNAYLADLGKRLVADQHLGNVKWVVDEHDKGHKAAAPYDAILIDGGIAATPTDLYTQLTPQGRLAAVWQPAGQPAQLWVARKHGQTILTETLAETQPSGLVAFQPKPKFEF